jgi:hypothetical protein
MKITRKDIKSALSLILENVDQKYINTNGEELKTRLPILSEQEEDKRKSGSLPPEPDKTEKTKTTDKTEKTKTTDKTEKTKTTDKTEKTPASTEKTPKKTMITVIQKMIGADKIDGQWGQKTSDSWVKWISSEKGMESISKLATKRNVTLKESNNMTKLEIRSVLESFIPQLSEETKEAKSSPAAKSSEAKTGTTLSNELKAYIKKNKGSAATIAKDLKYKGSLSGVYNMVKDLEKLSTSKDASIDDDKIKKSDNTIEPVTREDLKKAINVSTKKPTSTNAKHSLSAIPLEYVNGSPPLNPQGLASGPSQWHENVPVFLASGTGTSEYFNAQGKTINSNYDIVVKLGTSLKATVSDVTYDVIDVFIDGTLGYNAKLKNYTAIKKSGKIYLVPVGDIVSINAGKHELTKINESASEARRLSDILHKYNII